MLAVKGYPLSVKELKVMKNVLLQLFPDIPENPYLLKEADPLRVSFMEKKITYFGIVFMHKFSIFQLFFGISCLWKLQKKKLWQSMKS